MNPDSKNSIPERGIDPIRLRSFVEWCLKHIDGDEKGEAQIFLDRLFQAFGQHGTKEAGATLEERVTKASGGTSFADLVWKPVVLVEMKKRGENLQKHYRQAFDYWARLVPNRPRHVVLCNFDEFWVYDFETDLDTPKDKLSLLDLPARWGPLAFLAGKKPTFQSDREAVTRDAADKLAMLFTRLAHRGIDRFLAQRFILQTLVALFAEDIGLLEKYFVFNLLNDCAKPADSFDLLGGLFEAMNRPKPAAGGRFSNVSYFNGGLFAQPARVELTNPEIVLLQETARSDWSKVQPEIFGTLFQHSMDEGKRHAFGAHFTHPADIMKIVGPTIVEPWREQIEGARSHEKLAALEDRLHRFRVLDPACGSGNFLYIAYRELKRLEARLYDRMADFTGKATHDRKAQRRFSYLSAKNFFGIDILPFAVEIAKVTMMIARKLAIDELHVTEPALPLDNLDANFKAADALLAPDGSLAPWPAADVIIGNPPFLDARKMTMEHGRAYVGKLETLYPQVPRRADLCTYWFRRAHDQLPPCTPDDPVAGRAGLVGTQNVRNNESREGGLDHIAATGTIVEAVDNQPWSGEANVHVSIVNWVRSQEPKVLPKKCKLWFKVESSPDDKKLRKRSGPAAKDYELDCRECDAVNSALSDQTDVAHAVRLRCCFVPKVVFEGIQTGHDGFVIGADEADRLRAKDIRNAPHLRPFINGSDLLSGRYIEKPEFVIEMSDLDMIQAAALPDLLAVVKERVLPDWKEDAAKERSEIGRDRGEHQNRMDAWWALKRPRGDLQQALRGIPRYIACSAVMKRATFVFLSSQYLPTNALKAFVFPDDYSFGVLQSSVHWLWFTTKCSKLTERFRYTPESVFDTFPWPQGPTPKQVGAVAEAGRDVRLIRADAMSKLKGGLRALYRTLELPGANPLKDAHAALDAAVLAAYRFNPKRDLLTQILELNLGVAAEIGTGKPVTAPGVPPGYPNPKQLITDDCIRPNT